MNSRPPSSALIIHPLPPPPPPSPPPLPPSSPLFLFFPSSCFTFSLNDVGIEVKSGTELYTFVIFLHRQDGPFLLHTKKWISFSPKCLFCHCLYCCYYLHCFCLCCHLRGHFFIVVIFLFLSSLLLYSPFCCIFVVVLAVVFAVAVFVVVVFVVVVKTFYLRLLECIGVAGGAWQQRPLLRSPLPVASWTLGGRGCFQWSAVHHPVHQVQVLLVSSPIPNPSVASTKTAPYSLLVLL